MKIICWALTGISKSPKLCSPWDACYTNWAICPEIAILLWN